MSGFRRSDFRLQASDLRDPYPSPLPGLARFVFGVLLPLGLILAAIALLVEHAL